MWCADGDQWQFAWTLIRVQAQCGCVRTDTLWVKVLTKHISKGLCWRSVELAPVSTQPCSDRMCYGQGFGVSFSWENMCVRTLPSSALLVIVISEENQRGLPEMGAVMVHVVGRYCFDDDNRMQPQNFRKPLLFVPNNGGSIRGLAFLSLWQEANQRKRDSATSFTLVSSACCSCVLACSCDAMGNERIEIWLILPVAYACLKD